MTPKKKVLRRFPKAVCVVTHEQEYFVVADMSAPFPRMLGSGDSFEGYRGAWANAAKKLKR